MTSTMHVTRLAAAQFSRTVRESHLYLQSWYCLCTTLIKASLSHRERDTLQKKLHVIKTVLREKH